MVDDVPSTTDNIAYNRHLWDRYAQIWDDPGFRAQALAEERRFLGPHARQVEPDTMRVLGDEWGTPDDVAFVIGTYIRPYIRPTSRVAEIGPGGGRIACQIAGDVGELWCIDVSDKMLQRLREVVLADHDNVRYLLVDEPVLPTDLEGQFDFVYSFDVFVHLDLHTIWKYLNTIFWMLREGGRTFLHTANLATEAGWDRFAMFDAYSVEGFYFLSPELVQILVSHTPFRFVVSSTPAPDNFYLARDYLFVLEKPVTTPGGEATAAT